MTTSPPPFNLPPPAPPQGPPPPGLYYQPVPAPQTSVPAVVSLIAGLTWFFWIGSIVAIIAGHMGRRQVRELGYGGDALAIIGLIFGYIGAATFALFVILPGLFAVLGSH
jgi:hypothetical protein